MSNAPHPEDEFFDAPDTLDVSTENASTQIQTKSPKRSSESLSGKVGSETTAAAESPLPPSPPPIVADTAEALTSQDELPATKESHSPSPVAAEEVSLPAKSENASAADAVAAHVSRPSSESPQEEKWFTVTNLDTGEVLHISEVDHIIPPNPFLSASPSAAASASPAALSEPGRGTQGDLVAPASPVSVPPPPPALAVGTQKNGYVVLSHVGLSLAVCV